MPRRLIRTTSAALAEPRIVALTDNLHAVCLEVMKIIPAKHILERAMQRGEIGDRSLIVESSSGNFAFGLAVVCRELGLDLHIVGDPAIDLGLRSMLVNLGARIDIIEKPDAAGAYQRLRLKRVDQILAKRPDAFWVRQYDNPENPAAYQAMAGVIANEFGSSLRIVASVGSGGSSVGTARALRALGCDVELVGVDTFNSVLFGLEDGKRAIRGLGNSVMPEILDHVEFDRIHWLSGRQAIEATVELHARHALYCGPTSGATYRVAQHLAVDGRATVFIAPDTGYRYQQTVHDPAWRRVQAFRDAASRETPKTVATLGEVDVSLDWASMHWNRRSLSSVREHSRALELSAQ